MKSNMMMKLYQSKINQSTQKKGEYKEQNERNLSKKANEPPWKVDHKENIKILNPLLLRKAYQIRKGEVLLKGCWT